MRLGHLPQDIASWGPAEPAVTYVRFVAGRLPEGGRDDWHRSGENKADLGLVVVSGGIPGYSFVCGDILLRD